MRQGVQPGHIEASREDLKISKWVIIIEDLKHWWKKKKGWRVYAKSVNTDIEVRKLWGWDYVK